LPYNDKTLSFMGCKKSGRAAKFSFGMDFAKIARDYLENSMKTVILAGGYGTRINEESHLRPKPMVEIGGMPLLWHIMKIYGAFGLNDFIICCGYKGYMIKEYFANYFIHMSDVTIDLKQNTIKIHRNLAEPWKVTLVDTGLNVGTGGRLAKIEEYLDDEPFCMTYGDGVSDVDIGKLIKFHESGTKKATVTGIKPSARFGILSVKNGIVSDFEEKPQDNRSDWINGGFFVLDKSVLDLIVSDEIFFERQPMQQLSKDRQLAMFQHEGFWMCMDTLSDRNVLEDLWQSGQAPWKVWK
jgi:glucose-1-phosphate cytidylyltransferase